MAFWDKAQRVVMYKVKTEVEARKKEVMDRQVGAGCLPVFQPRLCSVAWPGRRGAG